VSETSGAVCRSGTTTGTPLMLTARNSTGQLPPAASSRKRQTASRQKRGQSTNSKCVEESLLSDAGRNCPPWHLAKKTAASHKLNDSAKFAMAETLPSRLGVCRRPRPSMVQFRANDRPAHRLSRLQSGKVNTAHGNPKGRERSAPAFFSLPHGSMNAVSGVAQLRCKCTPYVSGVLLFSRAAACRL
jgi:hypothetical protein